MVIVVSYASGGTDSIHIQNQKDLDETIKRRTNYRHVMYGLRGEATRRFASYGLRGEATRRFASYNDTTQSVALTEGHTGIH